MFLSVLDWHTKFLEKNNNMTADWTINSSLDINQGCTNDNICQNLNNVLNGHSKFCSMINDRDLLQFLVLESR